MLGYETPASQAGLKRLRDNAGIKKIYIKLRYYEIRRAAESYQDKAIWGKR